MVKAERSTKSGGHGVPRMEGTEYIIRGPRRAQAQIFRS